MASITALNGVQWTEINGLDSEAGRNLAKDYINDIATLQDLAEETAKISTRATLSIGRPINNSASITMKVPPRATATGPVTDKRFASYATRAEAQAALNGQREGSRVLYWSEQQQEIKCLWVLSVYNNPDGTTTTQYNTTTPMVNYQNYENDLAASIGQPALTEITTTYAKYDSITSAQAALIADTRNNVATTYYDSATRSTYWLIKDTAKKTYRSQAASEINAIQLRWEGFTPITATASTAYTHDLSSITSKWGISASTTLTANEWLNLLKENTRFSYQEASKLKVADGGGIKTYDGKWYVNGEEVNYLEIFFAVNINKLFVINEKINTSLEQMNKNNKKIKIANEISNALAAISPTTTDGTKTRGDMLTALRPIFTKYGSELFDAQRGTGNADTSLNSMGNASAFLQLREDGRFEWRLKAANGSIYTDGTIFTNGGDALAYWLSTLIPNGYAYGKVNVNANFNGFLNYFPSSGKKVFAEAWAIGDTSATFKQTDFSTMTTELRSQVSAIESENTTLQTLLEQYNNKRTNTLDAISNIVKGNNQTMSTLARNASSTA